MNIKVLKNILEANDQVAARIRADLAGRKITAVNLISAPGAGKTSLLEKTIPLLKKPMVPAPTSWFPGTMPLRP